MQASGITQQTQAFTSSTYYISALLGEADWTGTTGSPAANITYSFNYSTEGGALLTSAGQAAAQSALQVWASIANIHLTQVSSNADITFSQKNLASIGAAGATYSTNSAAQLLHAEVVVDDNYTTFPSGSFANMIFLHEVGHALGLKHPGNYGGDAGPFLPAAEDNYSATVMSYNTSAQLGSLYPVTPMNYDMAAIQYLYGNNTTTNAGNTNYSFTGPAHTMTIWDAGGVDNVNAPAGSSSVIDLREGLSYVSSLGGSHIWFALGAHMENAIGNSLADTIFGNQYDNQVFGGGGNDFLSGGAGNDAVYGGVSQADSTDAADTIFGGLGIDTMFGNSGNDLMYGGRAESDAEDSADAMFGGKGSDTMFGNSGNDAMYGGGSGSDPSDTGDLMYGGKGADTLLGNGGNDIIYGGGSGFDPSDDGDIIYGGVGNDVIFGNGGNDTIIGNEGSDTLYGGAGNDIYGIANAEGVDFIMQFDGANAAGGDQLLLQRNLDGSNIVDLASLLSHMHVTNGNAVFDFGGGNSLTIAGVTMLGADDVSFFG